MQRQNPHSLTPPPRHTNLPNKHQLSQEPSINSYFELVFVDFKGLGGVDVFRVGVFGFAGVFAVVVGGEGGEEDAVQDATGALRFGVVGSRCDQRGCCAVGDLVYQGGYVGEGDVGEGF